MTTTTTHRYIDMKQRILFIDRDGTILAIHPTAEEVERILQEKLSHQ